MTTSAHFPSLNELQAVLDRDVTPTMASHNGGVTIKEIRKDGAVVVEFVGSCRFCPAAQDTLETLVASAFASSFPKSDIRVVLDSGVSDELIAQAKMILNKRSHQQ